MKLLFLTIIVQAATAVKLQNMEIDSLMRLLESTEESYLQYNEEDNEYDEWFMQSETNLSIGTVSEEWLEEDTEIVAEVHEGGGDY